MYDDDGGFFGALGFLIGIGLTIVIFKWIGIGVAIFLVIALLVYVVRLINEGIEKSRLEAAEKAEERKKEEEHQRKEEALRQIKEDNARKAKERETYNAYNAALCSSSKQDELSEATDLIDKMVNENDESLRAKIITFFDKYLPIMTETLDVSTRSDVDIDETIEKFNETVRNFYNNLYKANDVIEENHATLESMAAMDGLIDPYGLDIKAETEKIKNADTTHEKEAAKESAK